MAEKTDIKGLAFVAVYADDYEKAFDFYQNVLGLKKEFDMGTIACFFGLGEDSQWGLYLQGGNKPIDYDKESMRTAFVLTIESANELFNKLKKHNIKTVQEKPIDMGQGDFWFQCFDPCGNIIEFLGGE